MFGQVSEVKLLPSAEYLAIVACYDKVHIHMIQYNVTQKQSTHSNCYRITQTKVIHKRELKLARKKNTKTNACSSVEVACH
jgi:hypothetical protein